MTPETTPLPPDPVDQIRAIKANDDKALKLLYIENFSRVEKYVMQNSGTSDEARDVYQEAYIAVWRNIQLDRFEPQNKQSLNAYLFQVAKNKWLDVLKSSGRKLTRPLPDEENETPHHTDENNVDDERIQSIKHHFQQLGEVCRELLQRFYYERQSMKKISDAMKWTEATARNNKYRCLQKLRELIKK